MAIEDTVGVRGIGEGGQVQQDERELERPLRGHVGALSLDGGERLRICFCACAPPDPPDRCPVPYRVMYVIDGDEITVERVDRVAGG